MVGQAVGATGAAPAVLVGAGVPAGAKHNRPARRPVTTANSLDAGPTRMPVATKSCFFSRLLLRTPIIA